MCVTFVTSECVCACVAFAISSERRKERVCGPRCHSGSSLYIYRVYLHGEQGLASDPIRSDPIRSDPFRSGVATPEVPVASYNPVLSSLPSFITH